MLELIAWKSACQSFADADEDFSHCHGLSVSSSEVYRIAHAEGERAQALLAEREERWSEPVASDRPVFAAEIEAQRLCLEVDGDIVLTRGGEERKTVWGGRDFDVSCRGRDCSGRAHLSDSHYAAVAGDLCEFGPSVDALANRMGARSARTIGGQGGVLHQFTNALRW